MPLNAQVITEDSLWPRLGAAQEEANRLVAQQLKGFAMDRPRFGPEDLTCYSWHEAPGWASARLRDWVRGMESARDGEKGDGPDGAEAWLAEKLGLLTRGGLFQTFFAV